MHFYFSMHREVTLTETISYRLLRTKCKLHVSLVAQLGER